MALETLAIIDATVNSDALPGTINAAAIDLSDAGTINATLLTAYRDAFEAFESFHGYRVMIGDWDVTADGVDALEIEEDGHTGRIEGRIRLSGSAYSIWRTLQTNTLLEPVTIDVAHGRTHAEMINEPQILMRIVGADQAYDEDKGLLVDLRLLDDLSARLKGATVCYAIEPASGTPVGQILRELLDNFGILHDLPDGDVFMDRLVWRNEDALQVLEELAASRGWYLRRPDGIVRVGSMDIRPLDEPADYRLDPSLWTKGGGPRWDAPSDVPNRWVIRGHREVSSDEDGCQVSTDTIVVEGAFAPMAAVAIQVGGNDNPATVPAPPGPTQVKRIINRTTIERKICGGQILYDQVDVEGWDWRRAALAVTQITGNKHIYFAGAYVDADGEGRATFSQFFQPISQTRTDYTYNEDGSEALRKVTVKGEKLLTKPSLRINNPAQVGQEAYLYGDGTSYSTAYSTPMQIVETVDYQTFYRPDGRVQEVHMRRDAYHSILARDTGAASSIYFLNEDGRGMVKDPASFQETDKQFTKFSTNDLGEVISEATFFFGFKVIFRQGGLYTIDGVQTDHELQIFGPLPKETTTKFARRLAKQQTQVTTWQAGEAPVTENVLAPVPIVLRPGSAWTGTKSQPISLILDEPGALEAYGARVAVIDSPYADSQEVLARIVATERRRASAVNASISRYPSPVKPGWTVDVFDVQGNGMEAPVRTLVAGKRRTFQSNGEFFEEVILEADR